MWTEFFISYISIRINCNRISEGLLYKFVFPVYMYNQSQVQIIVMVNNTFDHI
jgi:hypothetical protein